MDNVLYESLCNYFDTLTNYGYKDYSGTVKLIIYCLLVQFYNENSDSLTADEKESINHFISTFYDSDCLISSPNTCE
jgi:hypothetical protein